MTIGELLEGGRRRLEEAGIADHKTDSLLFMEKALDKDRTFIRANFGEKADEKASEIFEGYIEKRLQRIPAQYILGRADFMGLEFYVNHNVLIPRFDTEFLVEEVMLHTDDGAEVLDVCTGSGCILLSLMCYKNDICGTGTDISPEALKVALRNKEELEGGGRLLGQVRFIESDLFENIEGTFDVIVSNPPYIRSGEIDSLMEEVRDHEPRGALDGGEDGLDFYRKIADEAYKHLNREGRLFFEIGYDEGSEVKRILEERGYRKVTVKKDYSGNERVVSCLNR